MKPNNIESRISRALLIALLLSVCLGAKADVMEEFASARAVNGDHSAFLVLDLASGEVMASHNPSSPLIPASIMKCVTGV